MAKLIDRCFCYFTAAMLVPSKRARTWRLLYKFGWNTFPNNARMNNRKDPNNNEFVFISIIFDILASWLHLLNGSTEERKRIRYSHFTTWDLVPIFKAMSRDTPLSTPDARKTAKKYKHQQQTNKNRTKRNKTDCQVWELKVHKYNKSFLS